MSGEKLKKSFVPAIEWSNAILPLLEEGHNLRLPLKGESMCPILRGGRDEAVISSAMNRKLRRGDIVLYTREDGTHILHRIHHVRKNSYYMLGDAHTLIEGPVDRKNVLAVASAVIRKGKTISCSRYDYRILSGLWLLVRPIRPVILRIGRYLISKKAKNNVK